MLYPHLNKAERDFLVRCKPSYFKRKWTISKQGPTFQRMWRSRLINVEEINTKVRRIRRYKDVWKEQHHVIRYDALGYPVWEPGWITKPVYKTVTVTRWRYSLSDRGREVLAYYAWKALRKKRYH